MDYLCDIQGGHGVHLCNFRDLGKFWVLDCHRLVVWGVAPSCW